jgi:hypothetical protein
MRKLPPPLEGAEQKTFVAWWRWQYPGVLLFAVANGAFLFGAPERRAAQMVHLKAQGLVPGIPDLFAPACQLWVEMKRSSGGRLSPEQAAIHEHLRGIGHVVIVAAGADAAMRQTREFFASAKSQKPQASPLPDAGG